MKLGNTNKAKTNVNIFQYLTAARLINELMLPMLITYFKDVLQHFIF